MARKILFINIGTHLGGAERSLIEFAENLSRDSKGKYEPHVITVKSEGPFAERLKSSQIPFTTVEFPELMLSASRKNILGSAVKSVASTLSFKSYYDKILDGSLNR